MMTTKPDQAADKVEKVGEVKGEPIYNVETPDRGTYQTFAGRVWKILHAGKLRELSWKRNEKTITRVCGAVARLNSAAADSEVKTARAPLQTFIFKLRTGSYGTYGVSTYEQEAESLEQAVTVIFERFRADGLLAYFSSLEHIGTESTK